MISALLTNSPNIQVLIQALTMTLLHFLWQGVVIAGVLKIILSLISVQRSKLRYGLSCAAMGANLLLPLMTFSYFFTPSNSPALNPVNSMPIAQFQQTLQHQHGITWFNQSLDYLPYLSLCWLICVVFLTSKLLIEVSTTGRLARSESIATDADLIARFNQLARQVGLAKTPRLVISLKAQVPMAIGWLKPVVLMPAQMLLGLNRDQLEMLLLHELAHIKRCDYLVNFLQTLIEILLFFHPAVMWVSKQVRQEREYCSDDIAVAHCGNAVAYARTLADTASLCEQHRCQHHRHNTIPTMALAASGGDLKARVVRLVNHTCTNEQAPGRLLAALVIIGSLLALSIKQFLNSPILEISGLKLGDSFFTPYGQPVGLNNQQNVNESNLEKSALASHLLASPNWRIKTEESAFGQANIALSTLTTPPQQPNNRFVEYATTGNNQASHAEAIDKVTPPAIEQPLSKVVEPNFTPTNTKPITEMALVSTNKFSANKDTTNTIKDTLQAQAMMPTEAQDPVSAMTMPTSHKLNAVTEKSMAQKSAATLVANTGASTTQQHNSRANSERSYSLYDQVTQPSSNPHQPLFETPASKVGLFEQRYELTANQRSVVNQHVAPAKLKSAVDPRYPSVAMRKGIELDVQVNFTIDEFGRVTDIEFEQQNKLSYFRSSIINAIEQWRFEPARANGEPVNSKMSKIFSFNLS